MGLRFKCPACGEVLQVADRALGDAVQCSACRKEVRIPDDPELVEHTEDPAEFVASIESREAAEAAQQHRDWTQRTMLWLFPVANPLIGSLKLVNYFMHHEAQSPGGLVAGILLICLAPFGLALARRKKWDIWGCVAVYGAMAVTIAVYPSWDVILSSLISFFLFLATVGSLWSRPKNA